MSRTKCHPRNFGPSMLLACLLLGGLPSPGSAAPAADKPKEAEAAPGRLIEGFMKGPIAITAKVLRGQGGPEATSLPLYQVPVLKFRDQLELSFAGEAFDERVTTAAWSLIVVFLPKTVAPTDQGVVSYRLQHKGGRMVVPAIEVPYDSIPMLFLIPDKTGRKKVLKDLNAHLESFRTLCAKIASLSAERAAVDKFVEDLEAIDKTMSSVQYDNAVESFLHAYGSAVSVDVQAFSSANHSNLDKCQFLTQEFQKTNLLVPDPASANPAAVQAGVTVGGGRPVSAYVSIFVDLATIISNLWPGHQFQYLPALARNFHDCDAELYYTDWIHTTGDTLGALMCCPGKWEEQGAPEFDLEVPWGESLLRKQTLLRVRPKEKGRGPFSLYGHDWKLLVTGPKGESLPPLVLALSPNKDAFVATPGPLLEPLHKLGATRVKARIVGRWGFTSIATAPLEVPVGFDPAWAPTAKDKEAFQIGKACAFALPATWAGVVDKVVFRPAAAGAEPMQARLKEKDGTLEAVFAPKEDAAGEGTLEIHLFGLDKPALARPLTLMDVAPELTELEARLGESSVTMRGSHLNGVKTLDLGKRSFLPVGKDTAGHTLLVLKAVDGKPFEEPLGTRLSATLATVEGRTELEPVRLQPARPRLGSAQVIPMAVKGSGLAVTSTVPVAPTSGPSQVNLLAAKGYRFPFDGAFHAALRNVEEPAEIRMIPATKIRVMGNNQKATFSFVPTDVLGGRASGKLEVQVQDAHAGASDWLPLPATFVDLPVIVAVQDAAPGTRLVGPSLDPIEAVAFSLDGPWARPGVQVEEGHETMTLAAPLAGNTCYLKVFGWPELMLAVHYPQVPASVKPAVPAPTTVVAPPKAEPPPATAPAKMEPPSATAPAKVEPPPATAPAKAEPPPAPAPAKAEPPPATAPAKMEPPSATAPAKVEPPSATVPAKV